MTFIASLTAVNAVLFAFPLIIVIVLRVRLRTRKTKLRGPSSKSFLLGYSKELSRASAQGNLVEEWEGQYGSAFQVPVALGTKRLVLCDLKAVLHIYSNDTNVYRQTRSNSYFFETFFGRNLLWAEADDHKRQRKALSSAFSNLAIRDLTPVFYDTAYALKAAWDSSLHSSSSNSFIVDVHQWVSHYSLDVIGRAGFSHDFESLKGKRPPVVAAFDSFGTVSQDVIMMLMFLLAQIFPELNQIPTKRSRTMKNVAASVNNLARGLLESAKAEKEAEASTDNSILATLIRSERVASASMRLSSDEVKAQFTFMVAGYETTTITLIWVLVELCRHIEMQQKLRDELAQICSTGDPTFEQLTNGLPYLDAVVSETLRLHTPGPGSVREAHVDDVIPLSKPVRTADGQVVDSIFVAKGSTVYIPVLAINRSEALWGQKAKDFDPSRWLDGSIPQQKASDIRGYRHLLTFGDGPRACIGRMFALTELKVMLSVLILNYMFELPDGPSTKFDSHKSILDHPKVAGQDGPKVPLIVRRVE